MAEFKEVYIVIDKARYDDEIDDMEFAFLSKEKAEPSCICTSSEFGKFIQSVNKAISDMQKLLGYEIKLKNAYGECDNLLDTVVDGLVKQAEEHKIGKPRKARLLTDEDVDKWEQSKSDREKLEKIELNLEHIDIAIKCAMCTNSMANDRGCDGGCRINEDMYKKVMDVIDKEIEQIVKEVEE